MTYIYQALIPRNKIVVKKCALLLFFYLFCFIYLAYLCSFLSKQFALAAFQLFCDVFLAEILSLMTSMNERYYDIQCDETSLT